MGDDGQHRGRGPRGGPRRSGKRCDRCRAWHRGSLRVAQTRTCLPVAGSQRAQHHRTPAQLRQGFRKPMSERPPCSWLKPDFVPLRGFGGHPPMARRRARSWRTVAMSAPGSPRPQGRQALRDTRNSLAVAEDLRRHLQTLKVIYRQQDSLGLSIAGQGYSLLLLAYSPGQLRSMMVVTASRRPDHSAWPVTGS